MKSLMSKWNGLIYKTKAAGSRGRHGNPSRPCRKLGNSIPPVPDAEKVFGKAPHTGCFTGTSSVHRVHADGVGMPSSCARITTGRVANDRRFTRLTCGVP